MNDRNFRQMLENQWSRGNLVSVGLDSEFGKIPRISHDVMRPLRWDPPVGIEVGPTIVAFNRAIVEATMDFVCAYKPNAAFYEAYGAEGIAALRHTVANIHEIAPDVPVILDAKRADIGNTNEGYAKFAFDYLGADAITVHPYLGHEAMAPFLKYKNKGIFVICRTSNPGAGEFQDMPVAVGMGGRVTEPLYKMIARNVAKVWNKNNNCGLVVGATYPNKLRNLVNQYRSARGGQM